MNFQTFLEIQSMDHTKTCSVCNRQVGLTMKDYKCLGCGKHFHYNCNASWQVIFSILPKTACTACKNIVEKMC